MADHPIPPLGESLLSELQLTSSHSVVGSLSHWVIRSFTKNSAGSIAHIVNKKWEMGDEEIRMKKWGDRVIERGSEECLQKPLDKSFLFSYHYC